MKKIIFIGLIIILLAGAGIVYLNNVFLPKTIRHLIIRGIEERTASRVTLGGLRVNILKGLVLTDLQITKQERPLIRVKEASCIFFPWSILEKKIAIPVISIKSPEIFLERREDHTFNLAELFFPKPVAVSPAPAAPLTPAAAAPKPGPAPVARQGFSVVIHRLNITNAKIIFRDNTLSKPFVRTLEKANLTVYLALPDSLKFRFSAELPGNAASRISASGGFRIPTRELNAKIDLPYFAPHEFAAYYDGWGLRVDKSSLLNISTTLKMKDDILNADIDAQGEGLSVGQGKLSGKLSLDLRAVVEYRLESGEWQYSGNAKAYNVGISGVEFVDKLDIVNCGIIFNKSGLRTENLVGKALGLPFEGSVMLTDFQDPRISAGVVSSAGLAALQAVLKDKFNFNLPGALNGQVRLLLSAEGKLSDPDALKLQGRIDLAGASLKLDKIDRPFEGISGKIEFLKESARAYPLLGIFLDSADISVASTLGLDLAKKMIRVEKGAGRYHLAEFSVTGNIDITRPSAPEVDLAGEALVDLKGLARQFPGGASWIEKANPQGKLKADFTLSGKINDLKNCAIGAKIAGESISLYGLKGEDLFLDYSQAGGIADISMLRLSLYGGTLEAAFKANFNSRENSFWLDTNMQGIKLEELKLDTAARSKDISGIIQGAVKLNGFLNDPAGSQGAGMLSIAKGRIWELDLFKGMGKLLFSQDFANLTFSQGRCDFVVKERSISTENLFLEGNIVNLSGPFRIGFDGALAARLSVEITGDLIPLTGTFKDVTTALMSETGKFAVIRLSGTLREPRYKFEAEVANILKGLADSFLKRL